jgi:hypothetical protein
MAIKLTNSASTTIAGAITATDTQLSVAAGDGAKFPTLGAGEWFPLTIVDANGNYEIVQCTARNGDVFTIARAQEGTPGKAFASGSRADLRITAAVLAAFMSKANNLSDLADVAAAKTNLGIVMATEAEIIANNANGSILTTDAAWAAAGWTNLGNVTGSITLDASLGTKFYGTLIGNVTVTVANMKSGQQIDYAFFQDATGGRTISWTAAGVCYPNSTVPAVNASASALALIGSAFNFPGGTLLVGMHA